MDFFSFDDDYVRRLQEGDRWTQDHFVTYFQQLLLLKLRGRLSAMADVEDVIQNVFLAAFAQLRDGKGPRDNRKLGAWVNGIATNVLYEWYRAHKRPTETLDEKRHDVAADDDLEHAFYTRERAEQAEAVLKAMPPRDGQILRALLEGREKDAICADFGVGRDYLRVLVHRAKERFRLGWQGAKPLKFSLPETNDRKSSL